MRSLVVLAILALAGCNVKRTFECEVDTECGSGRCETNGFCSFTDGECASGWRYDEYAGDGLGDRCVGGPGDAGMEATPPANCPAGYVVVGSLPGAYRYVTAGVVWTAAEADCENDGTGTHLAIIDAAPENTALQGLVGIARVWFGLTDRITPGTYRTVTNVVQTYLPWELGAPEIDDHCIAVKDALFAAEDCADLRPYVCECDGLAPVPGSY